MQNEIFTMHSQLGAITSAEIQKAIKLAPSVLKTASEYTTKAAAVAPKAVPILRELIPFLSYGPQLAPLAAAVSSNVAAILTKAPSYAPTLQQAIDVMVRAPEISAQIAAITGQMATIVQKVGEDPMLDVFINRLMTLIEIYQKTSTLNGTLGAATSPGIGLRYVVPWLDRAIFIAKHNWVAIAAPAAILVGVGLVGYGIGKGSR